MVAANDEQPCLRPSEETYRDMWGPQHRGVIEGGDGWKKISFHYNLAGAGV